MNFLIKFPFDSVFILTSLEGNVIFSLHYTCLCNYLLFFISYCQYNFITHVIQTTVYFLNKEQLQKIGQVFGLITNLSKNPHLESHFIDNNSFNKLTTFQKLVLRTEKEQRQAY